MHDVNPLGLVMYLRELDRQAAPKLRPLRPAGKSTPIVAIIAVIRRFYAKALGGKGSVTIANWFAQGRRPAIFAGTAARHRDAALPK